MKDGYTDFPDMKLLDAMVDYVSRKEGATVPRGADMSNLLSMAHFVDWYREIVGAGDKTFFYKSWFDEKEKRNKTEGEASTDPVNNVKFNANRKEPRQ